MMDIHAVLKHILAVFYPDRCCCCGRVIPYETIVCGSCSTRMQKIMPPFCPYCGRNREDCQCNKRHTHMERCISPYYYSGAAKSALMRFKFYNKVDASQLFISSMAKMVSEEYACVDFDYIIPVPISRTTYNARGYNQSTLLAKGLSLKLKIPWNETLVKLWDTKPQRGLPAYQRSGNVLGAFDVDNTVVLTDKCILLVDDIATTGSTLDECAKILKIYGAETVYAVTAAASRLSNKSE